MYTGKAVSPGVTKPKAFKETKPAYKPPTAPPAITAAKGRFSFKVTPYKAGSVIPNTAVTPADTAIWRISEFLVFNATAKQAAPCAILEGNEPTDMIVS